MNEKSRLYNFYYVGVHSYVRNSKYINRTISADLHAVSEARHYLPYNSHVSACIMYNSILINFVK